MKIFYYGIFAFSVFLCLNICAFKYIVVLLR